MVKFVVAFTPEELEQLPAWRRAINSPPLDQFIFALCGAILTISILSFFL